MCALEHRRRHDVVTGQRHLQFVLCRAEVGALAWKRRRSSRPLGEVPNASQVPRFHDAVPEPRDCNEQRARQSREHRVHALDEDAAVTSGWLRACEVQPVRGSPSSHDEPRVSTVDRLQMVFPCDSVTSVAVGDRQHETCGGSTAATTNASLAPGTAGMMSPGTTVWNAGTMLVALCLPPLSMASQLYQPARSLPICTIHGHTRSGGASMVMAWVDVKMASGIIASTGSGQRRSRMVAKQVASAITKWKKHLLCLGDKQAEQA